MTQPAWEATGFTINEQQQMELAARAASLGEPPLRLTGLDQPSQYRDTDSGLIYQGSALLTGGLKLDLPPGDYSSVFVRLVRES